MKPGQQLTHANNSLIIVCVLSGLQVRHVLKYLAHDEHTTDLWLSLPSPGGCLHGCCRYGWHVHVYICVCLYLLEEE